MELTELDLTYDEARELLRRAVAEKGAYHVYKPEQDTCQYFDGDTPSCIVGLVLAYKGVRRIPDDPGHSGLIGNYLTFQTLANSLDLPLDGRTIALLDRAQSNQDSGMRWGDAVIQAEQLTREWEE